MSLVVLMLLEPLKSLLFKIEEITERPSTGADASFDSTTEGFNNGAEWTPNK